MHWLILQQVDVVPGSITILSVTMPSKHVINHRPGSQLRFEKAHLKIERTA